MKTPTTRHKIFLAAVQNLSDRFGVQAGEYFNMAEVVHTGDGEATIRVRHTEAARVRYFKIKVSEIMS